MAEGGQDPYELPNGVLRNLLGLTTKEDIQKAERLFAAQRMSESLPVVPLNYTGLKKLHHHVFQDIYEWAGKERTTDVRVTVDDRGAAVPGARPHLIESSIDAEFKKLAAENYLRNLSPEEFSKKAAKYLCEINAIHPFRDGNGRAQQLFLKALGREAGHRIDISRIDPEDFNKARAHGINVNYGPMAALISQTIVGRDVNVERNDQSRVHLPRFAAAELGYAVEERGNSDNRFILKRDGEILRAVRDAQGQWSYENKGAGRESDRGDIQNLIMRDKNNDDAGRLIKEYLDRKPDERPKPVEHDASQEQARPNTRGRGR